MTNTVRLAGQDGSAVVLRPAQPHRGDPVMLQEFDLGYPAVREVKQDAAGRDGTLDFTARFGSRVVTAKAKVFDTQALTRHQILDLLRGMSAPSARPTMYVNRDGWTGERSMLLRGSAHSCVQTAVSAAYLEASMSWQAPSGVMEAVDAVTVTMVPPAGAPSGISVPVSFVPIGLALAPLLSYNAAVIPNPGNISSSPVIRIYGQVDNPTFTNVSTGQVLSLNGLTVPQGHYVEIDTVNHTAYMDSNPALSVYDKIDWVRSTWLEMAGVSSTVIFTAQNITSASSITITFRPRWI